MGIVKNQDVMVVVFNSIRDEYVMELQRGPYGQSGSAYHRAVQNVLIQVGTSDFTSLEGNKRLEERDQPCFNMFLLGILFGQGLLGIGTTITIVPDPKDLI